ncbi:hypothetical protein [Actinacidiphila acididurans]|uniref:WXG100 family type VII secretion target n=1 Tax=Actinacidiphila acididurans TaxID=2784346 RepID=A0ABS2TKT6_9ACTN|nr:hypothetical protein [Actinacidiphila acididurans]MBM9503954.1 hypothetical protein [Actinacidiphila acididurans]
MTDKLKVPPKGDFDSYAGLMDKQSGHFKELDNWVSAHCHDASDLNGLLVLPIQELAPKIADAFSGKLSQCSAGMTGVAGKARETGTDYSTHEHITAQSFAGIYGKPLPGFPDIGVVPGMEHLGDFTDEDPGLKAGDLDEAGDVTAKNIEHQLTALGVGNNPGSKEFWKDQGLKGSGNLSGHILSMADGIFKHFTGQSLVELIFQPITGNYGRLKYLQEAYDQLGDGIYTVSGTCRKGSVRLGGEWTGDAATAFDSLLFRWTMGSGGIGDAAKVVANVFRDGYYAVTALVQAALQAITRLINDELKQLVETAEGDAAIEAVGGGPEDPVADIVAGLWTLYKIYRIIKGVISAIKAIHAIYDKIKAAVSKIVSDVQAAIKAFSQPWDVSGEINSLVDQERQKGFAFEKTGGWDPTLGAARIAILPTP